MSLYSNKKRLNTVSHLGKGVQHVLSGLGGVAGHLPGVDCLGKVGGNLGRGHQIEWELLREVALRHVLPLLLPNLLRSLQGRQTNLVSQEPK